MIIVFLIVLIVALIIANVFVSLTRPKQRTERGFANPSLEHVEVPEVVQEIDDMRESTTMLQGSITATNKKLELLNERVTSIEGILTGILEAKLTAQKEEKK